MLKRFLRDENGATAIEYGLLAAFLGVSMIATFIALEGEYTNIYGSIETAVVSANSP